MTATSVPADAGAPQPPDPERPVGPVAEAAAAEQARPDGQPAPAAEVVGMPPPEQRAPEPAGEVVPVPVPGEQAAPAPAAGKGRKHRRGREKRRAKQRAREEPAAPPPEVKAAAPAAAEEAPGSVETPAAGERADAPLPAEAAAPPAEVTADMPPAAEEESVPPAAAAPEPVETAAEQRAAPPAEVAAPVPVAEAGPPPAAAQAPPAVVAPAPEQPADLVPVVAPAADIPTAEHQALWFALARQRPRSVALVAVAAGVPVQGLAGALAEIGRRLGDHPVTALAADPCDYDFVTRTTRLIATLGDGAGRKPGASPLEVIVALPPVTGQPLGLAVAQAVDAVVLCFQLGKTTIDAARETMDLVGRDRIVGCVAIGEA